MIVYILVYRAQRVVELEIIRGWEHLRRFKRDLGQLPWPVGAFVTFILGNAEGLLQPMEPFVQTLSMYYGISATNIIIMRSKDVLMCV